MTFSGPLPVGYGDIVAQSDHIPVEDMPVAGLLTQDNPSQTEWRGNVDSTSSDRSPILIQRVRDRVGFPAWFINGLIDGKNPDTHR